MSDRDVIRRALFDGIDWQLSLADAYANPADPSRKAALRLVKSYRGVLKRRYRESGLTPMEELADGAESLGLDEISRRHDQA